MSHKVVGRAEKGKGPHAQHVHPVVLTGGFAKQESREKEHLRKSKKRR